ncbi:MAG: hypothetical protein H0T65_21320, partial [Deltaproteobacteria bacterium]|nr:hypothetical protein [Deltaproteobacteria bacterium]
MSYEREKSSRENTRAVTSATTENRVGKQSLTETLPALPQISEQVEDDALVWEDISPASEATQESPQQDSTSDDEDKLVGVAPRSNKGVVNIYENKDFYIGKLKCTFSVKLEHSQVVSGGVNRETETTPSIGLLSSERQGEVDTAGKKLKGAMKVAFLSGRLKLFESFGLDLKLFEASQSTDKAKSLKDLMTMAPSLDVVKLSGWLQPVKLYPFEELKRLEAAGIDVRLKAELSVNLDSLLSAAELDDLKKLSTKVDDAIKRMDDLDRKIFETVDDGTEKLTDRMAKSRYRKGALGKKNRISKQELRALLKEIDDLKLPAKKSKIYQTVVKHMLGKRLGSFMARVALRSFTKLTRLIPVVGWVMLAWDLFELGYLAYKIYDGSAKFGIGGAPVSLLDIFDSAPEAPAGDATQEEDAPDESRKDELSKLDADQRAQLLATGTPLGRLMKGIATQMPEGDVKVQHLTRLIQIAQAYQLDDKKVDEALKLVIKDGPPASPDKTLDMLENILKTIAQRASIDRDGDGKPDGDGTGQGSGNGNGKGDGRGDGKQRTGKRNGKQTGNGDRTTSKRDGSGDGDKEADGPIYDLEKVLDDPIGQGLVQVLMTSGGLTDPQILRDTFMTQAAVVEITEARFLGGHQKQVKNDQGSMTMEIRLELLVYRNRTDPPALRVQSSSYGWFEGKGIVRLRDVSLQGAIASAVKKKLKRGSMEDVTFDIVDQKRIAGGYNVKVRLTSVRGVLLKQGANGPERLEV